MFGDENNAREVEEALARHACRPAGLGFGSYFDLDQLAHQVQSLKVNLHVSGLSQQCKSLFTMESPTEGAKGNDGRAEMDTDVHGAHSEEGCCFHGDDEEVGLLNIPVQAFLHILQYLDAKDICSLSSTCRQCSSFCSDQQLWKSVLKKDMVKWSEVSHGTYPSNLTTQQEEVDYKDIYMRCNPELQRDATFNLASIPRLLWSFLPHRTPIIVMFGPGLETDTSTIVRKFITGHGSNIIKVNGVFPAMYPGVGTGFEVTVNNKSRLRLVVLYSATRKEREARDSNQPRMSKLIKRTSPPNQGANSEEGAAHDGREDHGNEAAANHVTADDDYLNFEPNDHVKSMCRVVGGFIFVVDAAQQLNQGSCSSGRPELFAFMDSRWTPERRPLLVLSSVANPDVPRIPCVRVADQLSLDKLQRPWKVVDCDVSSLSGLSEGVDWLVGSAQKM